MVAIILAVIFFCLGLIFLLKISTEEKDEITPLTILFFGLSSIMVVVYFLYKPQAIDVYQGKTTLEITYRNGVPIDSVVIFKTK